jgi:hypothetical protein
MKLRGTALVLAALALAIVLGLRFVQTHKVPALGFQPVPKTAPILAKSDVENLLAVPYELVRHVRQVPPALKQSFTNFTGLPFDMSDPGDPMSTDDMTSGATTRQLIFAAVGKSSAVLVYEQGSFASYPNVVVFSYGNQAKGWAAALESYPPRDIPALQRSLRESRFKTRERKQ